MTKHRKGVPDAAAVKLAAWVTAFVNAVWGRRLRAAKSLVDTITDVLENGYSEDDVRSCFWVTAALPGTDWLKDALRPGDRAILPELVLRFHGGTNPVSGQEAKQWLPDRLARVEETSPRIIEGVIARVAAACGAAAEAQERAFLSRVGFPQESIPAAE